MNLYLELIELIYNYSIKGKYVDKEFIGQLINAVVKEEKLKDYVQHYTILPYCEENKEAQAVYDSNTKTIIVYRNPLEKMLEEEEKELDLLSKIEQIFYKNVSISQIILHELEHVIQKKIEIEEETIEALLFGLDNVLTIITLNQNLNLKQCTEYFKQYKDRNYIYSPKERLAEINSYKKLLNALHLIEEFIPNLVRLAEAYKLCAMLLGYELDDKKNMIIYPTVHYLQGLGIDLKIFDWYDENPKKLIKLSEKNYSLEDRIKYGLPITDLEFEKVLKSIIDKRI